MKKLFLILATALLALNVSAQKTTVAVGAVTGGNGVSSSHISTLRNQMISGLTSTQRLNVMDVNNLGLSTSNVRVEDLQPYNIDNLITAHIHSIVTSSSYKDGKTTYKTEMKYTISVVDTKTGQVTGTSDETHYGSSYKNWDEAYADLFTLIGSDMRSLVNKFFRLSGKIVTIDESNPKKGAISVYIEIGSDDGATVGTTFEVFKEVEVAGQVISKKIGEIKSKEVSSGSLTLCKVTKGGKEIQEAFDDDVVLVAVSKPGLMDSLLN